MRWEIENVKHQLRIKLVDIDPTLIAAWKEAFLETDVEIIQGDICRIECDAVVSPANSFA